MCIKCSWIDRYKHMWDPEVVNGRSIKYWWIQPSQSETVGVKNHSEHDMTFNTLLIYMYVISCSVIIIWESREELHLFLWRTGDNLCHVSEDFRKLSKG